jgi:predicted esterase
MRSSRLVAFLSLSIAVVGPACSPSDPEDKPSDVVDSQAIEPRPNPKVQTSSTTRPAEKPPKPLALAVPQAPSSEAGDVDLSKQDPELLERMAARLAAQGNNREAARYQYWAVNLGAGGEYNLACWLALSGDLEGAFYWLQEAALEDGVDSAWAGQDSDLVSLRQDARWKSIAPFLKRANAYWAVSGIHKTLLVLPQGYQKGKPIGVVVGLHGMGDKPDGYADPESYQGYADELNMAIVGVSGTIPKGRSSFVWSENAQLDLRRIREALKEVSDRLTVEPGRIIVFGFSQGAQMGFEVALQNPKEFRGAIVMSPGVTREVDLTRITPSPQNKTQAYVCLCGAGEAPGNVIYTKDDAEFARKAGARVELKLYEGQNQHSFPADFDQSFVRWVRFVDGSGSESKIE